MWQSFLKNLKSRDKLRREIFMMKYEKPNIEIVQLHNDDVVITSTITNDPNNPGTEWWG